MNKWLRTGAPSTLFLLLIYALAINFFYLSHPIAPVISSSLVPKGAGLLYIPFIHWLQNSAGFTAQGFTILAFVILFLEAIVLNAIVNRYNILPGVSFFTAFCFLLFSSFFPSWHTISAQLISGLFLLLFTHQLFKLFDNTAPRATSFNLGLLAGIMGFFYQPALGLILLAWMGLYLARYFKLSEWLLVLLGLLCPWYFLSSFLFLTDQLSMLAQLQPPGLSIPTAQLETAVIIGLLTLILYFLYGSIRLQQEYSSLPIQNRKLWSLVLAFTVITILLPLLPAQFHINGWLPAFFPISILIASGFYSTKRRWIGRLLHFLVLGLVIYIQWFQ
ncbi:MAG TPA: hypothetical protein VK084_05760 [Chitinophagaceae bacterium]|nr:hypothetical protein [Chitinophagaceae bacterium]